MVTVHRLCKTLALGNPLEHSTCIGYAITKPTCGIAVAAASRSAAITGLERICDDLEDGSSPRRLQMDLEAVARLLHCKNTTKTRLKQKPKKWQGNLERSQCTSVTEQRQRRSQPQESTRRQETPHRQETSHSQETPRRQSTNRPTSTAAVPPLASYRDEDLLAELTQRSHAQSQLVSLIRSILDDCQAREQRLPHSRSDNRRSASSRTYSYTEQSPSEAFESESEDEDDDSDTLESDLEPEDEDDDSDTEQSDLDDAYPRPAPESATSRSTGHADDSHANDNPVSSDLPSLRDDCGICLSQLGSPRDT